jgi:hypothetical protein
MANGAPQDELSGSKKLLSSLKSDPLFAVLLVAFLGGGGAATTLTGFSNPRPDPYTGAEAAAHKQQERELREAADNRILEQLQQLNSAIARLDANDARQWATVREHISQLEHPGAERRLDRLEKEIHRHGSGL